MYVYLSNLYLHCKIVTAKIYIRQVVSGLIFLHTSLVIHRDLKTANLLITTDGIVKLADFGVSKGLRAAVKGNKPGATNLQTMAGSAYWMAPEVG